MSVVEDTMVVSSMPCSVPPRPPSSCGAMVQSRFLRKGVSDLPQVRGDRERAAGGLHAAAHRRPREEGRRLVDRSRTSFRAPALRSRDDGSHRSARRLSRSTHGAGRRQWRDSRVTRSSPQSVHQSDDISSQSLHLEVMQLLPLMESLEECLALSQRDGDDDQSELVDERVVDQARDE